MSRPARAMTPTEWSALWRADRRANRGYPKSRLVLFLFRCAQFWRGRRGLGRVAYLLVGGVYKFVAEWMLDIELPASTSVGPGLRLRHGVGVVVNPASVIGAGVMLRHGVTIGNMRESDDCPVIGDFAEFGAGATIVGRIRVGARARVAPGVFLSEDVPDGSVVLPPRPTVRLRRDLEVPASATP